MLNDDDALWLIAAVVKRLQRDLNYTSTATRETDSRLAAIQAKLEQYKEEPLEMLIHCPRCLKQHIDEGKFAKEAHRTHACQFCGLGFVASKEPSVGVQFFSGWKNEQYILTPSEKEPQLMLPHLRPGESFSVMKPEKP